MRAGRGGASRCWSLKSCNDLVARAAVSKMLRLLMGFSEMEIPRWGLGLLLHDFSFHAAAAAVQRDNC